jgi:hypothetical protein
METKVADFRTEWEAEERERHIVEERRKERENHLTEARRVARSLLMEYPDIIPNDRGLTEKQKVEGVAGVLAEKYTKRELERLGTPDPLDLSGGGYKKSLEKHFPGETVLYRGRDSLGREKYSVGGEIVVINLKKGGPSI